MIKPTDNWIKFSDEEEKLTYMKGWKLASATATYAKTLTYSGGFTAGPVPCYVRGRVGEYTVVIEVDKALHCVNADCLYDMQTGLFSSAVPEVFVVLDVETTGINPKKDEIIEIAAVKYIDGVEAGSFEALVNPCCSLRKEITALTGLTDLDLFDAPCIEDVIPQFAEFLGTAPIVAHNAPFDTSFLSEALNRLKMPFNNPSIDTLKLARNAFPDFRKHSLEHLKEQLGILIEVSHRAMPDVLATAMLYSLCVDKLRESRDERTRAARPDRSMHNNTPKSYPEEQRYTKFSKNNVKVSELQPTAEVDIEHPLYGKIIVFTGELSLDRKDAMQLAINAGALVKTSVSKKTDYLVVGKQDVTLVGDDGMSTKEEKAYQLNKDGHAGIRILCESEYLDLACKKEMAYV